MAVRGIHTSDDAYPLPPEMDVYGFWINDPYPASLGGVGENSYKTVDELLATYYFPLATGDSYDGEYVAICEPPETDGREEIFAVPSPCRFTAEAADLIWTVQTLDSPPDELVNEANAYIVAAAIEGVSEQLIPYDQAFARSFARTVAGTPIHVRSEIAEDYYAVPFTIRVNSPSALTTPETGETAVVILVDATDGHFREASWVQTPVEYLPVSESDALGIAYEVMEKLGIEPSSLKSSKVELVHIGSTPYYPHWRIVGDGFAFLIGQDGSVEILPSWSDSP
jgi:hypothetical protein